MFHIYSLGNEIVIDAHKMRVDNQGNLILYSKKNEILFIAAAGRWDGCERK